MAETKPTPNPATRRPTTMVARAEAANILQEEKEEEEDGGIVSSSASRRALALQDARRRICALPAKRCHDAKAVRGEEKEGRTG